MQKLTAAARARIESSARAKLTAARTSLILGQPFFGTLVLSLPPKVDWTCPTAWVNGRDLGYNPQFVDSLKHHEIIGLLTHEVMHCACGHPWRRGGRAMRLWNESCDRAINDNLRQSNITLPPDALYPEGDEAGKSAEWIYTRRSQAGPEPESKPDENQDEPGEDENGAGESDEPGDQPGNGESEPDPLGELRDAPTGPDENGDPAPTENDWKERIAAPAIQAELAGNLPAGMKRMVEQARKGKVDVRSLLLRFFQERASGDYSWARPNPRYIAQGPYLPGLYSEALGEVCVFVDTSGSISGIALEQARGILESVIEECDPARVSVYYVDADVQRVDRFDKGEPIVWEPMGGGGTDFRSAFAAIERDENPVCVVAITDLYATFPEVPPSIPVLWLSTTEDMQAPFGETVYCDK